MVKNGRRKRNSTVDFRAGHDGWRVPEVRASTHSPKNDADLDAFLAGIAERGSTVRPNGAYMFGE